MKPFLQRRLKTNGVYDWVQGTCVTDGAASFVLNVRPYYRSSVFNLDQTELLFSSSQSCDVNAYASFNPAPRSPRNARALAVS
jgi:hypothetical protein